MVQFDPNRSTGIEHRSIHSQPARAGTGIPPGCSASTIAAIKALKDSGVPLAVGFAYCAIPALLAAVLMFLLRPKDRDRGTPVST